MIERLLTNLDSSINPDPQAIPALLIQGTGTIFIKDNILQIIGDSSAQFNLRTYTLGSLVNDINSLNGFSANCLQIQSLSATVLLSGNYTVPVTLNMFTSFLWQLLKPVALALLDAIQANNQSLLEQILTTSDGAWLDSFGEFFGIFREAGEPDSLYAIRVFDLSVAPRVNNVAIQNTLQDIGYPATIIDEPIGNNAFDIHLTLPTNPPSGFIYSLDQMGDIVNQIKPSGIRAVLALQNLSDTLVLSEALIQMSGSVKYGSGRKWGQAVWS